MDLESQLYDIYGFWHVPFWQTKWFFYSMLCFGLFIVFAALFYIVHRRRRNRSITYSDQALLDLTSLLRTPIGSPEQATLAYNRLVSILKEYLAKRYAANARAMTDEELLVFLAGTSCPTEIMKMIEQILKGGVEIRFAGQQTYQQVVVEAINSGIIIVKNTMPIDTQP